MSEFRENVFTLGSCNRIYIDSDHIDYAPGEGSEPVIQLVTENGDELLTATLDAYHLTELRKALQRAEKWLRSEGAKK